MIYRTVTIEPKVTNSVIEVIPSLSGNISANAELVTVLRHSQMEEYDGPYEFTPTQSTQTALTENRVLLENIIINPIPSNYGLITYNGSVLTVS